MEEKMEIDNKFKYLLRSLGGHAFSNDDREMNDYYATDPIAAEWLLKIEDLNPNIWECACGGGHLSKVFEENGFNVRSTDLVYRGYGQGGIDFLTQTEKWPGDIVTNPPYKYALDFVEHGLDLVEGGNKVCLFLRIQFLESQRRRKLFDATPPKRIWVASSRIKCSKNGTKTGASVACYAWFVWEKGYQGDTVVKWFN